MGLKQSKAKADKYFSLFIRKRDEGKPCITCGRYTKLDCGHFLSRRHEATRYDEKNSHGQCIKCNRFEYGNQYEHAKAIDRLYGDGTADELYLKSKMFCKRNMYDYEQIAKYYKDKL
jgi:hypothetical protein